MDPFTVVQVSNVMKVDQDKFCKRLVLPWIRDHIQHAFLFMGTTDNPAIDFDDMSGEKYCISCVQRDGFFVVAYLYKNCSTSSPDDICHEFAMRFCGIDAKSKTFSMNTSFIAENIAFYICFVMECRLSYGMQTMFGRVQGQNILLDWGESRRTRFSTNQLVGQYISDPVAQRDVVASHIDKIHALRHDEMAALGINKTRLRVAATESGATRVIKFFCFGKLHLDRLFAPSLKNELSIIGIVWSDVPADMNGSIVCVIMCFDRYQRSFHVMHKIAALDVASFVTPPFHFLRVQDGMQALFDAINSQRMQRAPARPALKYELAKSFMFSTGVRRNLPTDVAIFGGRCFKSPSVPKAFALTPPAPKAFVLTPPAPKAFVLTPPAPKESAPALALTPPPAPRRKPMLPSFSSLSPSKLSPLTLPAPRLPVPKRPAENPCHRMNVGFLAPAVSDLAVSFQFCFVGDGKRVRLV